MFHYFGHARIVRSAEPEREGRTVMIFVNLPARSNQGGFDAGNHLADDVLVDRWQICRFTPPSHVLIEVGVAHAGNVGYHADAKFKASSIVVDFITPETETSIWYFWGMARNFNPNDKALTASIREGQGKIFSEDLEMLERQQKNLLAHPDRALLKLNIDSGGVQSRRVLDRILAAESVA